MKMKLWLLRPIETEGDSDWEPWYDKAFGHVVRAEDETDARRLAAKKNGDEGRDAWLNRNKSTCIELTTDGGAENIMTDFASA
jgi:hypothetical protein